MSSRVACPKCGKAVDVAANQQGPWRCVNCGAEIPVPVTAREAYNLAADLATGVNFRKRDNILQAKIIGVCLVLGAPIGALVVPSDRVMGAVVGVFAGLLIGLFGSGIYLMIYRAIRHSRGQHD